MAFPTIPLGNGVGSGLSTANTSFNVTVSDPPAGRLLLAFLRYAAAPGAITFTGYTLLAGPDVSDATDDSTSLYYRWTDGTEGTVDTVSTVNSVKAAALVYGIDGAINPAIQAPQVSTVTIGTTANADSAIVTPTGGAKDYLFLSLLGMDSETATATAPTNYSANIGDSANSGTGGAVATNCMLWGAWRQLNAASEDPGAWTSTAPATGWTAWTVAVHPASAPGPASSRRQRRASRYLTFR
jgi:hypothetical protein